jgi:hypothetical protein
MTTKTGLAVAAMLGLLLSTGCGRISDPVATAQAQPMAAPSHFELSSTRLDPAAQDGMVFEYH